MQPWTSPRMARSLKLLLCYTPIPQSSERGPVLQLTVVGRAPDLLFQCQHRLPVRGHQGATLKHYRETACQYQIQVVCWALLDA